MPKLRFKGFTDDWEQRKLGELANIGDIDHRMPKTVECGIPYLMTGDFCGINELNFDGVKHISEEDYEQLSRKIKPEKNDILFARYASVGAIRYVDFTDKFLISYSCAIIKHGDKIDSKYLYHYLTSDIAQRQIALEINTGSQANIGIDSMKNNILVQMPCVDEQRTVASYLDSLDNLITLHQRKCDELQKVKKYMLQKMFPKKGEKVPEIRFAGFTGDWEQRKLGEFVNFSKGTGYSKGDLQESGTPIILYGRLYTKYETVISNVDTFAEEKPNSVFSKGGEVVVPASGETAEDIAVASVVDQSGVLLGGDLNVITPPSYLDSAFLAISISNGKPHSDMAKMAQGKSVVHLHNYDLAKIDLPYPSYEEQYRISQHFKNIDNLITLHQRKHDTLKEIKKYMLQNMFPKK